MKSLNEYSTLKELVDDNGGIKNFRFWGNLDKYYNSYALCAKIPRACDDIVECRLVEEPATSCLFTLDSNYKIAVISTTYGYAKKYYSQKELLSLLKGKFFLIKNSENQRVRKFKRIEPLCGKAYLVHSWMAVCEN